MTSYAKYAALPERLRALGLAEDTALGAPLCRWRREDLIVDVMPVDEHVLGFSNRWYRLPSSLLRHLIEVLGGFFFPDEASQRRRSLVSGRLGSLSVP